MKLLILDSSSLIRDPEILSLGDATMYFVVPSGIIPKLSRKRGLSALIESAAQVGALRIQETNSTDNQALLEAARKLQAEGEEAIIVTESREVQKTAKSSEIRAITIKECWRLLKDKRFNEELAKSARKLARRERLSSAIESLAGFALYKLAGLAWEERATLAKTANVWVTLIIILGAGIFLYCLRARFRLTYAILEFLAGFATAASVFYPSFDYTALDAIALLKILGGLYVMVRGQDNLAKALQGTRFENGWKKFSGEPIA